MQRAIAKRVILATLMVAAVSILTTTIQAATREYEIKAGFIYNFLRFIEWPSPGQSWTVGVLGSDPFEGGLRDFEAKPLSGKSITVRNLADVKDAKVCQVVYIGPSEGNHVKAILASLKNSPVLTISDLPEFAEKGGGIGLVTQNNRVRFIVNLDALKQANLKANARFLNLAIRTISASSDPNEVWNATTYQPSTSALDPLAVFGH